MSTSDRQNSLFVSEDWTKIYQTFRDADFTSYDFETIRATMVQYLRNNYPEDFNDYIESSEFIALMDLIAYFGQSLAFRQDLNARENFLETAQRRDSVLRLAKLLSYQPKRNQPARGMLKITSIGTTESVTDSTGRNLADSSIVWNDTTNPDYLEHFAAILNAAMSSAQNFGNPALKKTLSGIKTDLYELNLVPETIPVVAFNTSVAGQNMPFEVVNGTFENREFIYEQSPRPGNTFNMFYRQDGKGAGSSNTGFFVYFKQGKLETVDFTLDNALSNRLVSIDVNNINNDDVWLFEINPDAATGDEWTKVPAITGNNVIYNSLTENVRSLFAVNSRTNDQVDLVFGDGVFADVPVGSFRSFYRTSNGRTYRIKPGDIKGLRVSIQYVSRTNTVETLTLGLSLQYTIDNATARETLADIKLKAPQQYYTQNRMVNGEDYNIFPLVNFNNVMKSKAINRTSSGISRFLDVRDVTGKYSSTNIYSADGGLYRNEFLNNKTFTWLTDNDIYNVLRNTVEPILRSNETEHFYLANYERKDLSMSEVRWVRVSFGSNYSTGYFTDSAGNLLEVGTVVSNNRQYVTEKSMIEFVPPTGQHFMLDGTLMTGAADHSNSLSERHAGIVSINNNGSGANDGLVTAQTGAVRLNENIPSGAILNSVLPGFVSDLPGSFESSMFTAIKQYKNFAIGFDYLDGEWYIINSRDISTSNVFSRDFAQNSTNTNKDASWLIKFSTDGSTYSVAYRGLQYYFTSESETRFYYDEQSKVYDPINGLTKKDTISVLGINKKPTDANALVRDIDWNVYDVVVESDGYRDNTKVLVTFADQDDDGVIDNPNIFDEIVGIDSTDDTPATRKFMFLKRQIDYDNFDKFVATAAGSVNHNYKTLTEIEAAITNLNVNQVLYAVEDNKFYIISNSTGTKTAVESLDYQVYVGRDGLKFHYTHNSPNNRRIDPSPGNIIDIFVLTRNYNDAYIEYIQDTSNTVTEPEIPTVNSLRSQFNSLEGYKTLSDAIIMHSAKFKPLFGSKADNTLQASFKVVKNAGYAISDSEIKTKLVAALNEYFVTDNWDFGETFFFSELSAYLHQKLTPYLNSVVIVPRSDTQAFGSLYQISCEHDEIFVSAATVNDVDIIDAITASNIKATGTIFTGNAETTSTGLNITTTNGGNSFGAGGGGSSGGNGGGGSGGGGGGGGGGGYGGY
mgnify:FL=1|tara:strand:- start:19446 stop:23018 length:3573 start_codon:yes stop_codon:yes gene_type:complete